jgi:hypothetical protein
MQLGKPNGRSSNSKIIETNLSNTEATNKRHGIMYIYSMVYPCVVQYSLLTGKGRKHAAKSPYYRPELRVKVGLSMGGHLMPTSSHISYVGIRGSPLLVPTSYHINYVGVRGSPAKNPGMLCSTSLPA